jgi:CDP-glycerol glycerophosphotransferase
MPPRISVVVPIYNVETYLEPCLESLAAQTHTDFEAILVDDGSTDASGSIAEAFAARDHRFRLVRQPNGGLSRARNTGIDHATGEFIAFLDSDDMLPPNAYELLLGALESTGSDFATGNVHRVSQWSRSQSRFLARAFGTTQLKTHVTKFRPLLSDRTAWNKLWRRSFWNAHGLRFPEGVVHEDIPVVLPAHFLASSVDVLEDVVYLYRVREDGKLSITQRRLEQRVLLDRLAAVEKVSGFLAEHGPRNAKRWYDESAVADDLRLHLNILDRADDDYRALFLDRVNAYLDTVDKRVFDPLTALDRLKWHLVRRRLMPELLEVLRFQKEDLSSTPPVRIRGRWYGDYPFRTDTQLRIPREIYRLDSELSLEPHLEELRREGDKLHVRGYAFIRGVGAPGRDTQRLELTALRGGRLRRLRMRISGVALDTKVVHRPELTSRSGQSLADVSWSGFEATLDVSKLRGRGGWGDGVWDIYATARSGRLGRRRARFVLEEGHPVRAVELHSGEDAHVKAASNLWGRVTVEVRTAVATLRGTRLDGEALVVSVDLRPASSAAKPKLEVLRKSDGRKRSYPLEDGSARIPLKHLRPAAGTEAVEEEEGEPDERVVWELTVVGAGRRPVVHPEDLPEVAWAVGERQLSLFRNRQGDAALLEREPRPLVTELRWTGDHALELAGTLPPGLELESILLVDATRGEVAFPVQGSPGTFSARLEPAGVDTLAGSIPLPEGNWNLRARPVGASVDDPAPPLVIARALHSRLPLRTVASHKPFALGIRGDDAGVLVVERDLDDDERGTYMQRRLRRTAYEAKRDEALRDAVVYASFRGRQYSDSPRAIHEELVRREAPLEHFWVVAEGQCVVPSSATPVREGSREHHELLATARFVVYNDHFPAWFHRRDDQLSIQTWHGTPFKRLGFDISAVRKTPRRFEREWEHQVRNWQYVLSPNRFSTPILRQAYGVEGEMLETGYPRVDALAGRDRDALGRAVRRRLGIPEDVRVVLYAPTYRDQVMDRRHRYRLDVRQDLTALADAVGPDTVLLVRNHHYVVDPVPVTPDGRIRDVSLYPDGTELLLAADVLITDYSSLSVDFANTGRPMLFYTYDLDSYRDEIRGFYLDFPATVPGPLLRTIGELGEALRDLDSVRREHAERYRAFRERFCELDDGGAAGRVIDRLFGAYGGAGSASAVSTAP